MKKERQVVVEIPMLPPEELNPNWHGHWAVKRKAVKAYKDAAFYCTLHQVAFKRLAFDKATVSVTYVIRDRRGIKDPDNALAAAKPAIDGCVAAGLLPNDDNEHIRYQLPVMFEVDKGRCPLTILAFKEVAE